MYRRLKVVLLGGAGLLLAAGILYLHSQWESAKESKQPVVQKHWEQIPIVSEQIRKLGFTGGEGGQWPHTLEVGKADSSLIFYGTNTGGIERSEDGGENWSHSMSGYLASGSQAFAIDPVNDRYVLASGIGDSVREGQGIYLSTDRGRTWELKKELLIGGNKAYADGLEYDESSYSSAARRCTIAYYSTPYESGQETGLEDAEKGLYRSADGGETWGLINEDMADAELLINPADGTVYAARADGIYVSHDMGVHFETIFSGTVTGFDISWQDGNMYLCDGQKLLVSHMDEGSFRERAGNGFPNGEVAKVAVSPVNGRYLLIQSSEDDERLGTMHQIYTSHDAGESWIKWSYDNSRDFFPYNSFNKVFAWSYADENDVWSFGGEHVIGSRDGGENWENSAQGICGVFTGGKFHFNVHNPDLIFMGFQDLNGALSLDAGKTWKYMDVSRHGYYGHVYGGYAASEDVFWGCLGESWDSEKYITISFDGGESFVDTGIDISSKISTVDISSYQSYNNPKVYFAANYRSDDAGKTWEKMQGCQQVYTHNPTGRHELYGCEKGAGYVVVSYDDGKSWSRVNDREIPLTDRYCLSEIQVDAEQNLLYVAANGKELYCVDMTDGKVTDLTENLPKDQFGRRRVNGIAVTQDSVLYVAGNIGGYNRDNTVICSEDGGNTWYDATLEGDKYSGDMVLSAACIRVHETSGDIWCSTDCYGLVRLTDK